MRLLSRNFLRCNLASVENKKEKKSLHPMLFKAIKRINLSCGSKTCFYTSNEDSVILRIKRRWMHSTGFVCYIPSLFVEATVAEVLSGLATVYLAAESFFRPIWGRYFTSDYPPDRSTPTPSLPRLIYLHYS